MFTKRENPSYINGFGISKIRQGEISRQTTWADFTWKSKPASGERKRKAGIGMIWFWTENIIFHLKNDAY